MGMFTELIGEKRFDFDSPVNKELELLAASRGDKLIGFGIKDYLPKRVCDYRNFQLSCGHNQDIRVVHYRKSGYRCRECLTDSFHTIAKSHGLTLVSMGIVKYSNDREYSRPCGHIEIHSHNYLLKHTPSECQTCIRSEVEINATRQGFNFVEKVREGYSLECCTCHTRTTYRTSTARNGSLFCSTCFKKVLSLEALSSGFTYLEDREPLEIQSSTRLTLNRWYSCNTCDYVDNYNHVDMRMQNVKCDSCFEAQKVKEAKLQGMEYLGHVEKNLHSYKLPCDCIRVYPINTIRRGVWACETHGNTHYHRESGVYLLELEYQGFVWLKFGYAKNLDIRLKGYGLPDGCTSGVLFYQNTLTGYDAIRVEKQIHMELKDFKIDPFLMKKYMTNTGHTECYPIETKQTLLDRLNLIKERYTYFE